ncbi:MAG TPA: ABC transporter substrate-binding protein [Clostridia bacterium]|nr:ABC transporter substrate-binding protein [Clostridia bacterium]
MKKKIIFGIILVLVASLILSGCGGQKTSSEDVIKIGVFEPMTGDSASGGQMTYEGIELANSLYPEVLGKKVELVLVDNKTDKTEAANAVNRLIDKVKVCAIIGSYGSSLSMAAGPIVKEKGVPAVGCSPTNPLVTKDNDYYFRVCFIDPFQGTVAAKYAVNEAGAKKAAILRNVENDYSVGLANYFQEAFVKLTGSEDSIVAVLDYVKDTQDFTAQLTTLANKDVDVIFAPGDYNQVALLIKQARQLGIKAPFMGGDTLDAPEFFQIGGADVEGVVITNHYSPEAPVTEVSKEFVEAYKQKYNKEANAFAALGFDAYKVILDAIERANSTDPKAIRDALAQTKGFEGATGIITLDENGDANKSAVVLKAEGGKFNYLSTVQPD